MRNGSGGISGDQLEFQYQELEKQTPFTSKIWGQYFTSWFGLEEEMSTFTTLFNLRL